MLRLILYYTTKDMGNNLNQNNINEEVFALENEEIHTLWSKAKKVALTLIPVLALNLAACDKLPWSKSGYERTTQEYIKSEKRVEEARDDMDKALKNYQDAVMEYNNAVRDRDAAKERVKEETERL